MLNGTGAAVVAEPQGASEGGAGTKGGIGRKGCAAPAHTFVPPAPRTCWRSGAGRPGAAAHTAPRAPRRRTPLGRPWARACAPLPARRCAVPGSAGSRTHDHNDHAQVHRRLCARARAPRTTCKDNSRRARLRSTAKHAWRSPTSVTTTRWYPMPKRPLRNREDPTTRSVPRAMMAMRSPSRSASSMNCEDTRANTGTPSAFAHALTGVAHARTAQSRSRQKAAAARVDVVTLNPQCNTAVTMGAAWNPRYHVHALLAR